MPIPRQDLDDQKSRLKPAQLAILRCLAGGAALRTAAIAERTGLSVQGVRDTLAGLESDGRVGQGTFDLDGLKEVVWRALAAGKSTILGHGPAQSGGDSPAARGRANDGNGAASSFAKVAGARPRTPPQRPEIGALAPFYGTNRGLAEEAGRACDGCEWVGVVFAGGMCEIPHLAARTVVVNDLHRHVINLARMVGDPYTGPQIWRRLRRLPLHPEALAEAQRLCLLAEAGEEVDPIEWAVGYFAAAWMGRNGQAGTKKEFDAKLSLRWNAGGGDSAKRVRNAALGLRAWRGCLAKCSFCVMDGFDFIARCEDKVGHALYADPPFPGPGKQYKHNCGKTDAEETAWHTRLAEHLGRFQHTRVVCRFYEHPLILKLYAQQDGWEWRRLVGRTQANKDAPECLVIKNGAK